jgi:hypothetical protein
VSAELRERWTEAIGTWNDEWDDFLAVDPGFFERYIELAGHPWRHGTLPPKDKELILLAVDARRVEMRRRRRSSRRSSSRARWASTRATPACRS